MVCLYIYIYRERESICLSCEIMGLRFGISVTARVSRIRLNKALDYLWDSSSWFCHFDGGELKVLFLDQLLESSLF